MTQTPLHENACIHGLRAQSSSVMMFLLDEDKRRERTSGDGLLRKPQEPLPYPICGLFSKRMNNVLRHRAFCRIRFGVSKAGGGSVRTLSRRWRRFQ